ncbi:MAG: poly-gamma-glutamate hydrolase family protein, partial [Bdellovibrio sp.]|nr:poly-gamma-glutamate hydrolase family protein [Bdellovibrio sp.]
NEDGQGWNDEHCEKISGTHPNNVVNRCERGLQLEMSKGFMDQLSQGADSSEKLNRFLNSLNLAIHRVAQGS